MRTFSDPREPSTPTREPFRKVDQIESLGQFLLTKEGCTRGVRQRGGEGYIALKMEWRQWRPSETFLKVQRNDCLASISVGGRP